MNLTEIQIKVEPVLKRYGVVKAAVFGSYARGDARLDSDLDVLVSFSDRKSLLTLIRMKRELTDLLGIEVDMLTEQSISPYLIAGIFAELKVIY